MAKPVNRHVRARLLISTACIFFPARFRMKTAGNAQALPAAGCNRYRGILSTAAALAPTQSSKPSSKIVSLSVTVKVTGISLVSSSSVTMLAGEVPLPLRQI